MTWDIGTCYLEKVRRPLQIKANPETLVATWFGLTSIFGCRLVVTPSARMHAFSNTCLIDRSLDLCVFGILLTPFFFLHSRNRHVCCCAHGNTLQN